MFSVFLLENINWGKNFEKRSKKALIRHLILKCLLYNSFKYLGAFFEGALRALKIFQPRQKNDAQTTAWDSRLQPVSRNLVIYGSLREVSLNLEIKTNYQVTTERTHFPYLMSMNSSLRLFQTSSTLLACFFYFLFISHLFLEPEPRWSQISNYNGTL